MNLTNNLLKTLLLIFVLLGVSTSSLGQRSFKRALAFVPFIDLPSSDDINRNYYMEGCFVDISGSMVVGRMYENFQCTQYFFASESADLTPSLECKYKIPDSDNLLALFNFGGATYFHTDVMAIVNADEQIIDTLEVSVKTCGFRVKQYRITSDCEIIVSRLIPTSLTSISFEDMIYSSNKWDAYRVDTYYHVDRDAKRFVKGKEEKFPVKQYTEQQLKNNNTWEL